MSEDIRIERDALREALRVVLQAYDEQAALPQAIALARMIYESAKPPIVVRDDAALLKACPACGWSPAARQAQKIHGRHGGWIEPCLTCDPEPRKGWS